MGKEWVEGKPKERGWHGVKLFNGSGKLVYRRIYFDGKGFSYSENSGHHIRHKIYSHLTKVKHKRSDKEKYRCPECGKLTLLLYEYAKVCNGDNCEYVGRIGDG